MTWEKGRRLQAGDRFRLHPDCIKAGEESSVYIVTRVSDCSATVKAQSKTHVVIPDSEGGTVIADFWRPGRAIQISPFSSVILLTESEN